MLGAKGGPETGDVARWGVAKGERVEKLRVGSGSRQSMQLIGVSSSRDGSRRLGRKMIEGDAWSPPNGTGISLEVGVRGVGGHTPAKGDPAGGVVNSSAGERMPARG